MRNLRDLLVHDIKDLYSAEKKLIDLMPEMAVAAHDPKLKAVFKVHLEETKMQAERVEKVARIMGFDAGGARCEAIEGLVKEAAALARMKLDSDVKDAALISSAQRMEHYEIASYGSAARFAEMLGQESVALLLRDTLAEEKNADSELNGIAEERVNQRAIA